jgi:mRNA-degrading endonuclease toxin of MazEF toxin-antitoxin module
LVLQLRAIDRRRVQERIGHVGTAVLQEMLTELDKLTGRAE